MPVDVLREAATRAVERTSLRSVAASVGMVPSGLDNFLNGAPPRARTVRLLREWYVRHAADIGQSSDETGAAAVAVLLDGIPPGKRRDALLLRVLDAVEAEHRENRTEPPRWFEKLRNPE